jgi:YVTN family beta-propeller protein
MKPSKMSMLSLTKMSMLSLTKMPMLSLITFVILLCLDGSVFAQRVVASIPVGIFPVGVAVNRLTNRVYVANLVGEPISPFMEAPNTVTVIVGGGPNVSEPEGVAVDPITNRVYVADFEPAGSVWVVDGRTNTLVATVPVGDSPFGIAVNLLTRRVYVANAGENKISVIEARTNNVIANVPVAGNPVHVAVDELRNRIYSCNIGKNGSFSLLSIINGGNNGVLATVPLAGAYCGGLALNMFTNLIYFTDENTDSVTVIRGTRR